MVNKLKATVIPIASTNPDEKNFAMVVNTWCSATGDVVMGSEWERCNLENGSQLAASATLEPSVVFTYLRNTFSVEDPLKLKSTKAPISARGDTAELREGSYYLLSFKNNLCALYGYREVWLDEAKKQPAIIDYFKELSAE
jgi:hypothetical protein